MKDKHAATQPADEKTPSPDEKASPFGPKAFSVDRGIKIAILVLLAAIMVVGGFLGWNVYSNAHLTSTQSPAARAVPSPAQRRSSGTAAGRAGPPP